MTDSPTYAAMEPSRYTSTEPTAELRWYRGKLEQKWRTFEYIGGSMRAMTTEWREIPEDH